MASVEFEWFDNNDMAVQVRGLRDEGTGAYLNGETVTADVKTVAGVSLGGPVPATLIYQTPGNVGGDPTGQTLVRTNVSGVRKLTVTVGLVTALSLSQNERIEVVGHDEWLPVLDAVSGAVGAEVDIYVGLLLRKIRAGEIVRLIDGNYRGIVDVALATEVGGEYDLEILVAGSAIWTERFTAKKRPLTS